MKNLILSIVIGVTILLFTGCTSTPKIPKLNYGMKKADMKIYVDNSLDKDKQKRVRDAFVYAIRKMIKNNQFKMVKTKGYVGEGSWSVFDLRKDKDIHHNGKKFYGKGDINVNVYEFAPFYYVNLYNFVFDGKHKLGKDLFGSNEYYKTNTRYTLKKIGDSSFEVKDFKTKREAIDIYLQILRDARINRNFGKPIFENYVKEYLKKTDCEVDWTTFLYSNNIVLYDPDELATNGRLILRPTVLDSSKKYQLKSLLRQKHYIVVDKPKGANLIISVQNLAFGEARSINYDSTIIKNNLKHIKIINPYTASQASYDYGQAATSFSSMNTPSGNTMAGVSAALGVLSMFDTSEYNITSLDYVSIFVKGKNIYNTVVSPRELKILEKAKSCKYGIGRLVSTINYASALEIVKLLPIEKNK